MRNSAGVVIWVRELLSEDPFPMVRDGIEFLGIVALASIGFPDSGVIGRNHLPHLLVAVT